MAPLPIGMFQMLLLANGCFRGSRAPVWEPPVDEPPVDEPPVDVPPVDEPPVDVPPVDVLPEPVSVEEGGVPGEPPDEPGDVPEEPVPGTDGPVVVGVPVVLVGLSGTVTPVSVPACWLEPLAVGEAPPEPPHAANTEESAAAMRILLVFNFVFLFSLSSYRCVLIKRFPYVMIEMHIVGVFQNGISSKRKEKIFITCN